MWKRKQWFVALVAASEDSQTHTQTHKERGKARRVSKRISRRCCERNEASHTHTNALKPQCILGHVWGVVFCSISPTKSLGSFGWGCVCLVEFILYGKTCQDNFSGRYLLKWHCAMIDKLMNCLYPCSSGFGSIRKSGRMFPFPRSRQWFEWMVGYRGDLGVLNLPVIIRRNLFLIWLGGVHKRSNFQNTL